MESRMKDKSTYMHIKVQTGFFLLLCLELCGTPGYLAPEILKCSMDELHPGYGKEVDL